MKSFLLLLLALLAGAPAYAGCPIVRVRCNRFPLETPGPTFDVSCPVGTRIAYDIPAGTLDLAAMPPLQSEMRSGDVLLHDTFEVSGAPIGTMVDLHLRVYVAGSAFAGGQPFDYAGLDVVVGADPPIPGEAEVRMTWETSGGSIAIDDSLDFLFQRPESTPFGLRIDASASAPALCLVDAHVSFRFVDLPFGLVVKSCNGFVANPATPATAVSWGRLKAAYR